MTDRCEREYVYLKNLIRTRKAYSAIRYIDDHPYLLHPRYDWFDGVQSSSRHMRYTPMLTAIITGCVELASKIYERTSRITSLEYMELLRAYYDYLLKCPCIEPVARKYRRLIRDAGDGQCGSMYGVIEISDLYRIHIPVSNADKLQKSRYLREFFKLNFTDWKKSYFNYLYTSHNVNLVQVAKFMGVDMTTYHELHLYNSARLLRHCLYFRGLSPLYVKNNNTYLKYILALSKNSKNSCSHFGRLPLELLRKVCDYL